MTLAHTWPQLVLHLPLLLAGEGRFVHLGSRFRGGEDGVQWHEMALLTAGLALVAGLIWLLSRYAGRKEAVPCNNPRRLFRELCRAHQLDAGQRRLLLQLAILNSLHDAARLFVEPERFEPERLEGLPPAQQARLMKLGQRLFAETETDAPAGAI